MKWLRPKSWHESLSRFPTRYFSDFPITVYGRFLPHFPRVSAKLESKQIRNSDAFVWISPLSITFFIHATPRIANRYNLKVQFCRTFLQTLGEMATDVKKSHCLMSMNKYLNI